MTFQTIRGLVRCARDAGGRLLAGLSLLLLLQNLAPAGIAMATALLIGRIQHAVPSTLLAAATVPLAVFALVLGIGHAADAAVEPLIFLAGARIDGAHRARITELAATSPTVIEVSAPLMVFLMMSCPHLSAPKGRVAFRTCAAFFPCFASS